MKLTSMTLTFCLFGLVTKAFGYSVADVDVKWNKKSVSVCWGDVADLNKIKVAKNDFVKKIKKLQLQIIDAKTKLAVQNKIQEQFTLENIGLEFTGWAPCSAAVDADIVLAGYEKSNYEFNEIDYLKIDLGFGRSEVGRAVANPSPYEQRFVRAPGEKGFIFIRKSVDPNLRQPEKHFLATALHEFGHAAGLLHEHLQADAMTDPLCVEYYNKEKLKVQLSRQPVGESYGVYDSQSIMNYCNLFSVQEDWTRSNFNAQLSVGDIHTLRCLYKPEAEASGSCEPKEIKFLKE